MERSADPISGVPARWWHTLDDGRIQCDLCPRDCRLHDGQRGLCFVRARDRDRLVLTTYGRSSGFCVDPIEKKPLNHFLPGTSVLSFGTAGCNLACRFCQNWSSSKAELDLGKLEDEAQNHKRNIDRLPIIPAGAKEHNVTCHYCIVGCGYKAYTWPLKNQGTTDSNWIGEDLSKQQGAETAADRVMYARAQDQGAMFGYELEQPPPPDYHYELPGPLAFELRERMAGA